jgi:hypothetical protein
MFRNYTTYLAGNEVMVFQSDRYGLRLQISAVGNSVRHDVRKLSLD